MFHFQPWPVLPMPAFSPDGWQLVQLFIDPRDWLSLFFLCLQWNISIVTGVPSSSACRAVLCRPLGERFNSPSPCKRCENHWIIWRLSLWQNKNSVFLSCWADEILEMRIFQKSTTMMYLHSYLSVHMFSPSVCAYVALPNRELLALGTQACFSKSFPFIWTRGNHCAAFTLGLKHR